MRRVEISWELAPGGLLFSVTEPRLLGKSRIVPAAEWSSLVDEKNAIGLGQLSSWRDEELAKPAGERLLVPHDLIVSLSEQRAKQLSLPPLAQYLLSLEHRGTVDQDEFRISSRWISFDRVPALGAERSGCLLTVGSRVSRLPKILYDVTQALDKFTILAPQSKDARLAAWARLQDVLPREAAKHIETSDYISRTRIAHAAAFSLSLRPGSDGSVDFDPVLFAPRVTTHTPDEPTLLSEQDRVLPEALQEAFAEKRFRAFERCQAHYALGEGWYVAIDDELRQALDVVRRVQLGGREQRREFARNPRAFLRAALGDEQEEKLEGLFVETAEFSQRVREIGLWQPPVLPWIQKAPQRWLPERFGLSIGGRIVELEPKQLMGLVEEVRAAVGAGKSSLQWNDTELPVSPELLTSLQALVARTDKKEAPGKTGGLPPDDAVNPTPGNKDGLIVLRIEQNLNQVGFNRVLRPRGAPNQPQPPASLRTRLKQHQQDGVAWLMAAWSSGLPGVLLADDMGLGKTLQALVFLAWLREHMATGQLTRRPIGIVAPVGLLKNWQQEHERHFDQPGLGTALVAYGSALRELRRSAGKETSLGAPVLNTDKIRAADFVLTTYETIRDYQHSFGTVSFAALVFDEAQKIKTPGTLMTEGAKAMNTDFVISMTGTPIENRLADLWCIMDMTHPGYLGDLNSFSSRYETGFDERGLRELKDRLVGASPGSPACLLRRMKEDQLEGLPAKEEHVMRLVMPETQAHAYASVVAEAQTADKKGAILAALQALRSVSLHPTHPDRCSEFDQYIRESARFIACFQALDTIAEAGEKTLVFLESLEMQPVLASMIQRRYRLRHLPRTIHGGVAGLKRQQWVNEFQEQQDRGFDAMILSPRAGGVGLTLTAANHVIHLSRWWNPAVEDQCTDRVYRIGQHKRVHVYYLQAVHPDARLHETSFDLKLHALLEKKRALSREFLVPPVDASDADVLFRDVVGPSADRVT